MEGEEGPRQGPAEAGREADIVQLKERFFKDITFYILILTY